MPVFLHNVCRLLVTANIPSSPLLVTSTMEVLNSSETSVLTRVTWHNIPDDAILQIWHLFHNLSPFKKGKMKWKTLSKFLRHITYCTFCYGFSDHNFQFYFILQSIYGILMAFIDNQ
jgi:hypothetical protein